MLINSYYILYNRIQFFVFLCIIVVINKINTQCSQSLIHMTHGYLFASDNGYYNPDGACVEMFFVNLTSCL